MLIGSTSRMVNGRKALKTVYWRVTNQTYAKNNTEKKLFKNGRTITFANPAVNSPRKVNSDSMYGSFDVR